MTYCLAIQVDDGLVFASDSRTNAGVDNVNTYPKMHTFEVSGDRVFVVLSSGNLATTQGVLRHLRQEMEAPDRRSGLRTAVDMEEAAGYLGTLSRKVQKQTPDSGSAMEATFVLGGQIRGDDPEIYLVYPEGNYIGPSPDSPFFQIGEIKYGKPILDRIVTRKTGLEDCARCALVSIDSTMKSNLTVGPPVDLLIYRRDALAIDAGEKLQYTTEDAFFTGMRTQWAEGLRTAFNMLPRFPWEPPSS